MSIFIDMRRVTIAEAKQTLPALVHEVERSGEVELTRRGKTVAFLVSAERHGPPKPGFVETYLAWLERHRDDVGDEPIELPRRRRARSARFTE
jgi:prevent-host-death family protein